MINNSYSFTMFCESLALNTAYTNCGWRPVVYFVQEHKAHPMVVLEDQLFEGSAAFRGEFDAALH